MSINLTYGPAAYVNFCTVDAAIGFYGKIPDGYEGVYQSGYVDELRGEIERLNQQLLVLNEQILENNMLYKKISKSLTECINLQFDNIGILLECNDFLYSKVENWSDEESTKYTNFMEKIK